MDTTEFLKKEGLIEGNNKQLIIMAKGKEFSVNVLLDKYVEHKTQNVLMEFSEFGCTPGYWKKEGKEDAIQQINLFIECKNQKEVQS